jgi:hypothetical protein
MRRIGGIGISPCRYDFRGEGEGRREEEKEGNRMGK